MQNKLGFFDDKACPGFKCWFACITDMHKLMKDQKTTVYPFCCGCCRHRTEHPNAKAGWQLHGDGCQQRYLLAYKEEAVAIYRKTDKWPGKRSAR